MTYYNVKCVFDNDTCILDFFTIRSGIAFHEESTVAKCRKSSGQFAKRTAELYVIVFYYPNCIDD